MLRKINYTLFKNILIFMTLATLFTLSSSNNWIDNDEISIAKVENDKILAPGEENNTTNVLNFKTVLVNDADGRTDIYLPVVSNINQSDWLMAGANPQRTSWVAEEVRGKLNPLWFKPIEPYIPPKVQIITAYNTLYISTARGLYALDAETGGEKWVYPTELPLGHSPTIKDGKAFVGGFDNKLHAIDAFTGEQVWTFQAQSGFDTNPLVVEGKVYAGNRDGFFYSVYADGPNAGKLAWKYKTGGPIHYSAAYKDGVVYFASSDNQAYALSAKDGKLVWKSGNFPGAGFHSWWPVIFTDLSSNKDYVIFSGGHNHRANLEPGLGNLFTSIELADVYPNFQSDPEDTFVGPQGYEPGNWAPGTPTIDTSKPTITNNGSTTAITEYFESKPWRRTYFILDRLTGEEYTSDFDQDGEPEYAPILWLGTHTGNRFPPVVGSDGVIYQSNNYMSDPAIAQGHITGWIPGSPFISLITSSRNAVDEPQAYAAGGDLIYWSRCCDRVAGAIDISIPYPNGSDREWAYFSYNLADIVPGYNVGYEDSEVDPGRVFEAFGGINGIYGKHGDQNPPIPYNGKVYIHRGNSIIAFVPGTNPPTSLLMAMTVAKINPGNTVDLEELKLRLVIEVEKIVDAGHLQPGYTNSVQGMGILMGECGIDLNDYWHSPSDTIYALIRALPYLPADLQLEVQDYIQNEFSDYPPYMFYHVGWQDGAQREIFALPPEAEADRVNFPSKTVSYSGYGGWVFPPQAFYTMWKYAEIFEGAKDIFEAGINSAQLMNSFNNIPDDALLLEMPYVSDGFIAGHIGYLELERMAGYPESADISNELARLLELRATGFAKDTSWSDYEMPNAKKRCRALNISRNFMYLVPEIAQYLREHALSQVSEAVEEYNRIAPYWFVSKFEAAYNEAVIASLYDYYSLFQAKALILREPPSELLKYLDVPSLERGDLFYMHNLISVIETQD